MVVKETQLPKIMLDKVTAKNDKSVKIKSCAKANQYSYISFEFILADYSYKATPKVHQSNKHFSRISARTLPVVYLPTKVCTEIRPDVMTKLRRLLVL